MPYEGLAIFSALVHRKGESKLVRNFRRSLFRLCDVTTIMVEHAGGCELMIGRYIVDTAQVASDTGAYASTRTCTRGEGRCGSVYTTVASYLQPSSSTSVATESAKFHSFNEVSAESTTT